MHCQKPIGIRSLQVGVEVDDPEWGKVTKWSHPACAKIASVAGLQGFEALEPHDQETLRSLAQDEPSGEGVSIDRSAIRQLDKAALDSQFSGDALESLKQMGVEVYAEGELERGIIQQAQQQLAEKDKARTKQRPAAAEQLAANGEAGGKRAAAGQSRSDKAQRAPSSAAAATAEAASAPQRAAADAFAPASLSRPKRAAATATLQAIDRSLDEQDRAIPSQYSAGTTQRTALNGEIPKLVAVAPHRTKAF